MAAVALIGEARQISGSTVGDAVHETSNLDEIESGLWLGNVTAATNLETLQMLDISVVLTLDSCPLPSHILLRTAITNKYIQVSDVAKEDLLGHIHECIDFIEAMMQKKKNLLVHCYSGTSGSAAIVIAYLMQKHRITFSPAFERVKLKRSHVSPNSGFVQQLRLFCKMGWTIDPQHEQYKIYRLRLAADKVRKAKILPQTCMDLVKSDPGLIQTNPEPHVYRCRKCRRIVANKTNIIAHKAALSHTIPDINRVKDEQTGVLVDQISDQLQTNSLSDKSSDIESAPAEPCKDIIFLEPLAWMDGILKETQGKLHCPKCQTKLGSFSWTMGCYCPCGTQVSPAFYLVPARVELCRSVQNVQMTV